MAKIIKELTDIAVRNAKPVSGSILPHTGKINPTPFSDLA